MFNTKVSRLRHIIVITYFLLFQLEFINSQTIINGSFELNTANSNQDYTNIINSQFNNLVTSCYSFGNQPSTAGLDLITTDNWDGKAKDGKWYVGIERKNDEYEELLSLELTGNLIENNSYKLTFYDNARESLAYTSGKLEIGLSEYNNSFGDLIFTTPENASYNKWTLRYFTFNAPNNGKYLTVRVKANKGQTWLKIDDFCLSKDDYCVELPEIEIPNVFTPNNDGVNDLFKPVVFKGMESGNMVILNRWGNVIYESNDLSNGWDGTFQNKPVSDGVYFYKIHYKTIFEDEEVKYGSFHLFR